MCPGRRRTFGCKVRASHSVMVECRPAAKIRLSTHATASTDASSPPRTHRSKCQLFVAFQSSMSPLFLQCSVGTEHGVTNEHTSRATMRPLHAPYQCNCVRFLTWQVIKFEIGVAKSGVACTCVTARLCCGHIIVWCSPASGTVVAKSAASSVEQLLETHRETASLTAAFSGFLAVAAPPSTCSVC